MYRLVDVSLTALGGDADYPNDARGALSLLRQWPQVMGPPDPFEQQLGEDRTAWFLYAYSLVTYAIAHIPNGASADGLRQCRQWFLQWARQQPEGVAPHVALANLE